MKFTYTHHAQQMLLERDLKSEWVERSVLEPESTEPDPKHPERLRAFRTVAERDGRVLRVVYALEADGFRIITVFLDRGRRP